MPTVPARDSEVSSRPPFRLHILDLVSLATSFLHARWFVLAWHPHPRFPVFLSNIIFAALTPCSILVSRV